MQATDEGYDTLGVDVDLIPQHRTVEIVTTRHADLDQRYRLNPSSNMM